MDQTIFADQFVVIGVTGSVDEIVSSGHILLASAGKTVIAGGGGNHGSDGPIRIMHVINMRLRSEKQPNVTYFTCSGAIDEPYRAVEATLQDIQAAIGNHASFHN
jgi:hypothetical protein